MHRFERYKIATSTGLVSKSFLFNKTFTALKSISLVAGLYKPSSISIEHGLILSSLSNKLTTFKLQLHGKRQKRTATSSTELVGRSAWPVFDKFIHELLPRLNDFLTPKVRRSPGGNYTLRLNHKFKPLEDFEELTNQSMFDTHRGVFLPLAAHFHLFDTHHSILNEHLLHLLKLPFAFYVRHAAPAFDDLAKFSMF